MNVSSCGLDALQLLNQGNITEKITLSRREAGEQLVFQTLQLDLEVVLLRGELQL